MRVHRLLRDAQVAGNFLARPPLRDERQNRPLLPREPTQTWKTGWVNASPQPMNVVAQTSGAAPAIQEPAARGGRKGFVIGLGGGFGMHQYTTPSFTVRNVTFAARA